MRKPPLIALPVAAVAVIFFSAVAQTLAQQQNQQQQAGQTLAPPKAYRQVQATPPRPVNDASFDAFRQQLAGIAEKRDRGALTRIVSQNFFWVPEDKDIANKRRPAIENLAKALGLDGRDPPGWEALAGYAGENTADPLKDPQRPGVICAPGAPVFKDADFDELISATQTDPSEWGYTGKDGIEVRSGRQQTAPVIEKLGMHLVRAYPEESPESDGADTLRIVAPSGTVGFIDATVLLPLATDQLCYRREGTAWKIAGMFGGTPSQ
jgi:hypothetical protein